MTQPRQLTLRALDIPSLHKFAVGFDSIFDELERASFLNQRENYPPYNVIRQSDDKFSIELAVAGFKEGEINITVEQNILNITGEKIRVVSQEGEPDVPQYLHQGISTRNFNRTFTLADFVEVKSAAIVNGILTIELEREVPEAQKPKTVAISYQK